MTSFDVMKMPLMMSLYLAQVPALTVLVSLLCFPGLVVGGGVGRGCRMGTDRLHGTKPGILLPQQYLGTLFPGHTLDMDFTARSPLDLQTVLYCISLFHLKGQHTRNHWLLRPPQQPQAKPQTGPTVSLSQSHRV